MVAALSSAHLLCEKIQERNETDSKYVHNRFHNALRFTIEGDRPTNEVVVRINRSTGIPGADCQFILDASEILKGSVKFEQTGEISVTF